jgi:hypothetical protein
VSYIRYPLRKVEFPYVEHRMQMAAESPSARRPPPLPQIVVKPEPTPTPESSPTPAPEQKAAVSESAVNVVLAANATFENPLLEAFDFFREAAKRADAQTPAGTIFDPTFRPAPPPPQPASSATYQVK